MSNTVLSSKACDQAVGPPMKNVWPNSPNGRRGGANKTSLRPKVSVGVPVYNGEKYLPNALKRLLDQEFEDFELVVCDNASTDGTQEICRSFAEKDSRIRYFRNETNIGLAANHNRTFTLSRGEFFKWAASDDDFPKRMLARFVEVMEAAPPSVSLVYSHCEYIDEFGTLGHVDSDGIALDDPFPHRRLARVLQYIHMYNSPYGLMRSEMLRKTRLHGLYPMADCVLVAELAMVGSLVEIPEPLLRIRRHSGRTFTANKSPSALREIFNPGQGRRFFALGLRTHMHLELIRSAALIPNSAREKMFCTAVAVTVPNWRQFKTYGRRQQQKLIRMFSPVYHK
jgi:glycosyltransferase involved in cell wall biosynthesis